MKSPTLEKYNPRGANGFRVSVDGQQVGYIFESGELWGFANVSNGGIPQGADADLDSQELALARLMDGIGFPEQLRTHAVRLNLTQAQLAAALSVSPRAIWQWTQGKLPHVLTQEGAIARLENMP